jgi:membrane protein implicated in regulation of membrane protease activity
MRVARLIAIAVLTAAALLLAAMGLMLITNAVSDASEVEAGPFVTVAVGCLFIVVALMAAWLARPTQRERSRRRDGAA